MIIEQTKKHTLITETAGVVKSFLISLHFVDLSSHNILLTSNNCQFVEVLRHKQEYAGLIPDVVIRIFHGLKSFWSHYGPGVDSVSNRNEYQRSSFGVKGGRCVGLTNLTTFMCRLSGNSVSLKFLNPDLRVYRKNFTFAI